MIKGNEIAERFDAATALTLGLEEELMLLDPESLDLAPRADAALAMLDGDQRFVRELPASQIETLTTPAQTVPDAMAQLAAARRDLAARLDRVAVLAASGTHAFAPPLGELNRAEHYDSLAARYGDIARRQQVFALQIHVAPGSADTALAVYNALRSYLPELAALAANSPFHGGVDTGHAAYRAKLAELLPRQGVPPAIASWDDHAAELAWGQAGGALPGPGGWWWELRPHHALGTLELRVPDAQTTVADAAAVVAFAHSLIAWLIERHEAGERLPIAPTWRINENRWFAVRDGLDATLADLESDAPAVQARERIGSLVEALEPVAARLGCSRELGEVAELLAENGAERQRRIAADSGVTGLVEWQQAEFLRGCDGPSAQKS
jgi:carboxylate-amine ligase